MSTNRPLVSVVIPFLNAEKFMQEAIESVFLQTYEQWELLLVDDGSTDGSADIGLRYASLQPNKVHYIHHENHQNRGASASRNLGSRVATGKYVAFLDADDVWLPRKLEQQVDILETHPEAGTVYGRGIWWYGWTGNSEDVRRDFVQELGVQANSLIRYPELLTLYLRDEDAVPSSFAIMVRRDVLEHVGGSEENWRSVYDDQVAFTKLAIEAPVFVADECWYRYRQHPDSRCSITLEAGQYHAVRLPFLIWLEEYLSKHGVKDGKLWSALNFEFAPTYLANGDMENGVKRLLDALEKGPLESRESMKLSKAMTERALSSEEEKPVQFVRDVFSRVPETPQLRRLRSNLLGHINAELAVRHRKAGATRIAWRHTIEAIIQTPSLVRNRALQRIALERLIGPGLVDRIRSR